jgi:O-methyltransferase involved in polyketide biosynthesis
VYGKPVTGFDPKSPNVARVYDYGLGGKDNFPADRDAAVRLLALYPSVAKAIAGNKQFVSRALTWVAGQGVGQFIDLGAGLPAEPAVHEITRAVIPDARVAYVDNDPVVRSHLNALFLEPDRPVRVVNGDIWDAAAVLRALAGDIDLTRPVCLIMTMVLHFLDAEPARSLVASYLAAAAPGSYVIASVGHGEGEAADKFFGAYSASVQRLYNHPVAEFARMLGQLELVPPGITDAYAWLPGWGDAPPTVPSGDARVIAAVGRLP